VSRLWVGEAGKDERVAEFEIECSVGIVRASRSMCRAQVKVDEIESVGEATGDDCDVEKSEKDEGKASIDSMSICEASSWSMTRSNAIDAFDEVASWRERRW